MSTIKEVQLNLNSTRRTSKKSPRGLPSTSSAIGKRPNLLASVLPSSSHTYTFFFFFFNLYEVDTKEDQGKEAKITVRK